MLNAAVARLATPPWNQTVALARALLALSTMIPLATTDPSTLFLGAAPRDDVCSSLALPNMFCLLEPSQYWFGSTVSLISLALVIVGVLPQVTCWAHAYVAFCFATAVTTPVGGDQVAQNLTLLLIPICVTWPGVSMWKPVLPRPAIGWREIVAWSGMVAVSIQAVTVYTVAFISKLAVMEWADGTALYYWFSDPMFGPAGWLGDGALALSANPWLVGAATFGSLAVEACLAVAFLYGRRGKLYALCVGIAFHAVIAVIMGLYSFSLAMIALLILYLGDPDRPIRIRRPSSTEARVVTVSMRRDQGLTLTGERPIPEEGS